MRYDRLALLGCLGIGVLVAANCSPLSSSKNSASHVISAINYHIDGTISDADVDRFRNIAKFSDSYADVAMVSLNSTGGSVSAAMAIGKIIREKWFMTEVDDNGAQCESACVLVFAAGAARIASDGSKVGIHRPHFPLDQFAGLTRAGAQAKYTEMSNEVRAYLADMGMSDRLYEAMWAVPSGSIQWLTADEMTAMSLIGRDPAYDEWLAARRATPHARK